MVLREAAAVPVFLMVTVSTVELVVPTVVDGKVTAVGERVMAGEPTTEDQLFTRLVALTEPRPVASSKPVVVE